MLLVGAFTTNTPAAVAAGTSTLSSPTPARAMIFKSGAAAMASESILVADRINTALAVARFVSNSARFAPSQCRISNCSPSTAIVAGDSSSAISTTGLDMFRL